MDKQSAIDTVAVIMDGNRRFAKANGLSLEEGYKAGIKTLVNFLGWAKKVGVRHVVAYAFSTENWNRGEDELKIFKALLVQALSSEEISTAGAHVITMGDIARFGDSVVGACKDLEEKTRNNTITLHLALSYGSREEIVRAAQKIKNDVSLEKITEDSLRNYFYDSSAPDPQILIRTGGEQRLSNFILWQLAYTELFFLKPMWPEFSEQDFLDVIDEYKKRDRRFGK